MVVLHHVEVCLLSILSKVRCVLATTLGDNSLDRNTQNQPRSPLFLGKGEREGGKNMCYFVAGKILFTNIILRIYHLHTVTICLILTLFYVDWDISSALYLPELARVSLCREKNMQTTRDWYRKLHVGICPGFFFISPRKRKGSCFQHGYLCLTFEVFPFFHPFMILSIWLQVVANKRE